MMNCMRNRRESIQLEYIHVFLVLILRSVGFPARQTALVEELRQRSTPELKGTEDLRP